VILDVSIGVYGSLTARYASRATRSSAPVTESVPSVDAGNRRLEVVLATDRDEAP